MPKSPPVNEITNTLLKRWPLPSPESGADKNTRGIAFIIAGTSGMPGTAILAATAAFRAGAGKVQVATPESVAPWIAVSVPETLVISLPEARSGGVGLGGVKIVAKKVEKANAVLIGPGMEGGKSLIQFVEQITPFINEKASLILDAEAMMCLTPHSKALKKFRGETVITPHAGEMASLTGRTKEEIMRRPLECAREFASKSGVITVMKGPETYIVTPDGEAYRNREGNVGLASSGSGDTLAGLIAGIAARGVPAKQAAVWGVLLHARAGDRLAKKFGPIGYLTRDLAGEVPALMAEF